MKKKLLILDLDETLLSAHYSPLENMPDFIISPYFFYKRPFLNKFLKTMAIYFDVAIWTSSSPLYARAVCNVIFAEVGYLPVFIWASDRCTTKRDLETDTFISIKNLHKLKKYGYLLKSIIMVDDSPEKHAKNYGNLVRIKEFNGEKEDSELLFLSDYLIQLAAIDNIRGIEKRYWRCSYSY